ncbi:MAG TPA: SOS response-associated peptidase family protein, partial [Candidatus Acidoferrum sp.]|nr:SOS response-associated peptidase family protein [Candidatus Acidoferrum sp.]
MNAGSFRWRSRAKANNSRDLGSLEGRQWQRSGNLLILTTTPNAVTAVVHNRMPVILDLDSHDLWLDPGMKSGLVSDLLKPFNAGIK